MSIQKLFRTGLTLFICWVLTSAGFSQSLQLSSGNWEDILWQAHLQNKAIFIYVGAEWCDENQEMVNTTMSSPELIPYFNRSFVNIQLKEGDEHFTFFQSRYPILGIPTSLFIDPTGELILSQLGVQPKEKLMATAEKIQRAQHNRALHSLLADFDEHSFDKKYLEEIIDVAEDDIYKDKTRVSNHFFQTLNPVERLSHYDFFMENILFASPVVADFVIDNYQAPAGFLISLEERQEHTAFMELMDKKLKYFYRNARLKRNVQELKLIGEIAKKLARKKDRFNTILLNDAVREFDLQLLSFYKENEMLREYAIQAIDVIDKYVLIKSPDQMREADIERLEYPPEDNRDYCEKRPLTYDRSDHALDSLNQLKEQFLISYEASALIDKITRQFLAFYEDEGALNKAAYWASMSYRYFKLAEYYLTHARVLLAQDKEEDALNKAKEGLTLGSPDPHIEEALKLFIFAIEGEPEAEN